LLAKEASYILNHVRNTGSERRFHSRKHQGAGTEQGVRTWSRVGGSPLPASAHRRRSSWGTEKGCESWHTRTKVPQERYDLGRGNYCNVGFLVMAQGYGCTPTRLLMSLSARRFPVSASPTQNESRDQNHGQWIIRGRKIDGIVTDLGRRAGVPSQPPPPAAGSRPPSSPASSSSGEDWGRGDGDSSLTRKEEVCLGCGAGRGEGHNLKEGDDQRLVEMDRGQGGRPRARVTVAYCKMRCTSSCDRFRWSRFCDGNRTLPS
jgi:hypothetical protein